MGVSLDNFRFLAGEISPDLPLAATAAADPVTLVASAEMGIAVEEWTAAEEVARTGWVEREEGGGKENTSRDRFSPTRQLGVRTRSALRGSPRVGMNIEQNIANEWVVLGWIFKCVLTFLWKGLSVSPSFCPLRDFEHHKRASRARPSCRSSTSPLSDASGGQTGHIKLVSYSSSGNIRYLISLLFHLWPLSYRSYP